MSRNILRRARWLVVLSATTGSGVTFTAPSNAASATVTATCHGQSLSTTFAVKEPSGVDHAVIASTVHRKRECGIDGLIGCLSFTEALGEDPGQYNLYVNNCTTKTFQAGHAAGVTLPNDFTPQDFGIDLNKWPPDDP